MRPQPEWMATLQPGDVLTNGHDFRVVRAVSYWTRGPSQGRLWGVNFAIRRCSWTGRCYTTVTAHDLRLRGFTKVPGVRVKLHTDLDQRIARALQHWSHWDAKCCDVAGVAA